MAMAPKRKRVNEVYQFFKQREGYFIREIENASGSSCGGCDYLCVDLYYISI